MRQYNKEYLLSLISIIKNNYGISEIFEFNQMTNGIGSNSFYLNTEKGMYIFKDIEKNHMNYPENEGYILEELNKYNICVPKLVKTNTDEYIINKEDKIYHLQTFIDGSIYTHNTAPEWLLYDSAEMLGKIVHAMSNLRKLPEGIGKGFFQYVTPDNAIKSHNNTLKVAYDNNDMEVVKNIEEKITMIERWSKYTFELEKMTCGNTHGDYSINQILCKENKINAVIDFTSACIHPIAWEVFRSYSLADSKCRDGSINVDNLKKYIDKFSKDFLLNNYDLEIMPYIYFYQTLVSDYYADYYSSQYTNKHILLENANMAYNQCNWLDKNIDKIKI